MEQFIASEVRAEAHRHANEVEDMLNAFADLLEAQEKAEPVAYADAATREEILNVAMRKGGYGCEVPLFVHPAPADAERLADTLFQISVRLGETREADMDDMDWHTQLIARAQYLSNKGKETGADVERLAEALHDCIRDLRIAVEYGKTMRNPKALLETVERAGKALAAHSAQAQPPAARVSDERVERARSAFVKADDGSTGITEAIRAALLAEQETKA